MTPDPKPDEVRDGLPEEDTPIAGDRGIPSVNRVRSVQARVSNLLAFALVTALGLGLLTWYYARTLSRPREAQHAAQAAVKTRAKSEMALPSLGPIASPFDRKDPPPTPLPSKDPPAIEQILGPAPPLPATLAPALAMPSGAAYPVPGTPAPKSPGALAFERRLAGPAFARSAQPEDPGAAPGGAPANVDSAVMQGAMPQKAGGASPAQPMNALLRATVTPAVSASVLPTRRFLLPKGAFIDCTLETAIDSTLPGMTTCITATDTFSADGTVVLLERGTKLVGETRGEVAQGAARVFVLWSEARTPTGVVVPLSSPGTDELGRSGLPGEVNRHFWDRFGAAILLTVINGAVQGAVNRENSGGSVVVSPAASTDVMTEVLRGTIGIPPTVIQAQGARIQVFVARDVDFRSVYALRVAQAGVTPERQP
jgi:type IV secretion system protein VirB10